VGARASKARAELERPEQRLAALDTTLAESAPAKARAARGKAANPAEPASFAEGTGAEG
jgi:hypothetical protein